MRSIQLSWFNPIWLIQSLFHYYGPLKHSIIIDQLLLLGLFDKRHLMGCYVYDIIINLILIIIISKFMYLKIVTEIKYESEFLLNSVIC